MNPIFLLSLILLRLAPAAQTSLGFSARTFRFNPATQEVTLPGEIKASQAQAWSNSNSIAFHLDSHLVVRFYTQPQNFASPHYTQEDFNRWGQREAGLLQKAADAGVGLPIERTGETKSGIFYAIFQKPLRGASAAELIKRGRAEEMMATLRQMTETLAKAGIYEFELNPSQIYVDRKTNTPYLIRTYASTRQYPQLPKAGKEIMLATYHTRREWMREMSKVWPDFLEGNKILSRDKAAIGLPGMTRMLLESMRTNTPLKIFYLTEGKYREERKIKEFIVLPGPRNRTHNDLLRGYFHAFVFPPEDKKPKKEYTFRLDRVARMEIPELEPE
ncbi:MAG: hypothetical protein HY399_07455 [Elusimicrobia bacterium]|nr:hypothetical protein [Elusimicrobiota bacterium]